MWRVTMSSMTPWRISSIVSRTDSCAMKSLALLEHDLALVVHDVVVLQDVLADVEVARLDLLLRLLDRLVDPGMDDRLAFLEAELLQHAVHAVGAEDAHQVVLERQVELRAAGIALAAGAAAQLVVDAPRFVALGADDVEPARQIGLRPAAGSAFSPECRTTSRFASISARIAATLSSRSGPAGTSFSSWAMRMSSVAAELDVGAAARPCWWRS